MENNFLKIIDEMVNNLPLVSEETKSNIKNAWEEVVKETLKTKEKKMYICRKCGEEFKDLSIHLHKRPEEFRSGKAVMLEVKDDHLDEYRKIENSTRWKGEAEANCFCGGVIKGRVSTWENGDYSVTVSCERCGFLWDED